MGHSLVVGMLRLMRNHCRGGQRRHQKQAGHQGQNEKLSLESIHVILPGCCLYRLLLLNPRNGFVNYLFGQQSTLNVFLYAPLLVDEHAHW